MQNYKQIKHNSLNKLNRTWPDKLKVEPSSSAQWKRLQQLKFKFVNLSHCNGCKKSVFPTCLVKHLANLPVHDLIGSFSCKRYISFDKPHLSASYGQLLTAQ